MSYTQLGVDDFVISADSISATLWSNGTQTLSTFFTASAQVGGSSGDFYINVYDTVLSESIQFAMAYGNSYGSGSAVYNSAVDGKSPTSTIYGQYQNLVIGDENTDFVFGAITSSEFFALPIERARYKESIFLGSLSLTIRNPLSAASGSITITDNSNYVTAVQFCEAGRVFQLITGSQGTRATITSRNTADGYTTASGSYGWLLPDIGTILLNPLAISQSINLVPTRTANTDGQNPAKIFNAISGSGFNSFPFTLNSQENISSDFIFVRPRSSQFNYSQNPSFISGSTGEVLYSSFINNPQVYITTVGLYNDASELVAVAKLSRPLVKDFTKEALVRVKLDF